MLRTIFSMRLGFSSSEDPAPLHPALDLPVAVLALVHDTCSCGASGLWPCQLVQNSDGKPSTGPFSAREPSQRPPALRIA